MWRIVLFAAALVSCCFAGPTVASACLKVSDNGSITINPKSLKELKEAGLARADIFAALAAESIPESMGCWSSAAGNFDSQVLSVGALQWNFGQKTLQSLLQRYRSSFASRAEFEAQLATLMPKHGRLIFSEGCLRTKGITAECRDKIAALEPASGKLDPVLQKEMNSLFESQAMVQIQTDVFVKFLDSVISDLRRLFPDQAKPSALQIKWAIDTKNQQHDFPGEADVTRVRKAIAGKPIETQRRFLRALVLWYEGLARSADQGGTRDFVWNLDQWRKYIDKGPLTSEQVELMHISFLRSRIANGDSGLWQANTFARRTKIILGVGSVAGRRD